MLKSGNGDPARCAELLVRTIRGTVPFVRSKGMDYRVIDLPETEAHRVQYEAFQVLRDFEPRIDADTVDIGYGTAATGDLSVLISARS